MSNSGVIKSVSFIIKIKIYIFSFKLINIETKISMHKKIFFLELVIFTLLGNNKRSSLSFKIEAVVKKEINEYKNLRLSLLTFC